MWNVESAEWNDGGRGDGDLFRPSGPPSLRRREAGQDLSNIGFDSHPAIEDLSNIGFDSRPAIEGAET